MSLYSRSINTLVYDSIQECIDAAKICIDTQKGGRDDCCFGIPALILLCCAIDSMGSFYYKGYFEFLLAKFKGLGSTSHFSNFYDAFSDILKGDISKEKFCKGEYSILGAFRNRCVHNTGLYDNCLVTTQGDSLYDLYDNKHEHKVTLNICKLYDITLKCFDKFIRDHPIDEKTNVEGPYTGNTSC